MLLSNGEISAFIKIYNKEFDDDIAIAEASEIANRLITLYEILLRPLPTEREKAKERKTGRN